MREDFGFSALTVVLSIRVFEGLRKLYKEGTDGKIKVNGEPVRELTEGIEARQ